MVMLAGQAPLLGGLRQPGRGAFLGRNGCQLDQFHQALTRGFAVAGLGAVLAAVDHQHAVGQRLAPGERLETQLHVWRQRRVVDVEAELDRGRHLVDVLATGTRGPHEPFVYVKRDSEWRCE